MELSEQDYATLKQLEEDLWREKTRFNSTWMTGILAADFFEFGRSGRVYSREECLAISPGPIDASLPLPDFRARLIDSNVAQVTYNSAVTSSGIVQHARRSSLWSRTRDGWVLKFHQGTPFTP